MKSYLGKPGICMIVETAKVRKMSKGNVQEMALCQVKAINSVQYILNEPAGWYNNSFGSIQFFDKFIEINNSSKNNRMPQIKFILFRQKSI